MPSALASAYRKVYRTTRVGDLLRVPVRGLRMRIRSGPCEGYLLSLPSRSRYLRGDYEQDQAAFTQAVLGPGDVFWDVGAHFGYYTLLAARATGGPSEGVVYAFEPLPSNLWFLHHHIAWNRLENATAFPYAIAGRNGKATFSRRGSGSGMLGRNGSLTVEVRTIDSLVASGECRAATFLKLDVEGAEVDVLIGAEDTLRAHPALVIISLHESKRAAVGSRCRDVLQGYGYSTRFVRGQATLIAAGTGLDIPQDAIESYLDR